MHASLHTGVVGFAAHTVAQRRGPRCRWLAVVGQFRSRRLVGRDQQVSRQLAPWKRTNQRGFRGVCCVVVRVGHVDADRVAGDARCGHRWLVCISSVKHVAAVARVLVRPYAGMGHGAVDVRHGSLSDGFV